ncbi:MAG TPA: hypothetical protein VM124_04035 [Candidatus Limnocylindrales bacterium]|nr:hypothetical protein [Candidatus Limnocylindrales bacterium]
MFKKLIGNLPFNPSLITQVSFYAKRLRRENAARRAGFVLLALTMLVQFFAVVSPPQPSLASSDNDLIVGGITSKENAITACLTNDRDYGTILGYYGITCGNIGQTSEVTLKSTDYNKQLYSMGHTQYGLNGETPVTINNQTLWLRYLWAWDGANTSSYQALSGKSDTGLQFFILFNCGNLVFVGIPKQADKPSRGALDTVDCDLIRGWAFDESKGTAQIKVHIYIDDKPHQEITANQSRPDVGAAYPGVGNNHGFSMATPASLKDTGKHSVSAYAIGIDALGNQNSVNPVVGVLSVNLTCKKPTVPKPTTPTPTTPKPTTPTPTDVCPNKAGTQTNVQECDVCSDLPGIQLKAEDCKPCDAAQTRDDKTACLDFHKTAKNITQGLADANGTTAHGGDIIEYSLSVKNSGKTTIKYVVTDGFGDVLDYADITDLHGAKLDENKNVVWPATDITSGQTLSRSITIKVKDPVPATPVSSSDPGHYDLTMTNVYNDTVNIKLPAAVNKQIETVTQVLPNTGPGTSLVIGFIMTSFVAYFFARSKLFATELDLVREDFSATGGQ